MVVKKIGKECCKAIVLTVLYDNSKIRYKYTDLYFHPRPYIKGPYPDPKPKPKAEIFCRTDFN